MKKQTMYNRLQKQYEKLNQSIQKAMKTGRFYAFTQFKQEQLLSRLKRCSFQLKQLGAGVAVVAALGMATPAVGQVVDFDVQPGASNPFNGFTTSSTLKRSALVDIDTDGDLDLFLFSEQNTYNLKTDYYENTGSATAPVFLLQPAISNPLNGFTEKSAFSFVDIDGDGDLDLFTSRDPKNYPVEEFNYYKNMALPGAVAVFSIQAATNNPLDSVLTHTSNLGLTDEIFGFYPSFVDIDNDGDLDCFMGIYAYDYAFGTASGLLNTDKLWYYENTGTAAIPDFQRQNLANNPAAGLFSSSVANGRMVNATDFIDIDEDGDYDMVTYFDLLGAGGLGSPRYFRNEGSSTNANMVFVDYPGTPIDTLYSSTGGAATTSYFGFADLDDDGDLDATVTSSVALNYFKHEGLIVSTTTIPNIAESIEVYPNPTTGQVLLEAAVTGQLQIFNSAGQEVYAKELEQEQEINLSSLEAGLYLLRIKEDKGYLQQTVVIQK